jgi:hypothetical protein
MGRLPLYRTVKSLTSRFDALNESGSYKPALIRVRTINESLPT